MRRVFYACDDPTLFIPPISHIVNPLACTHPASTHPASQLSSLPRLTTQYIDIPQHENTLAPIPDRHPSSASDWHSWIQPSAGSLSLYSVPPPPLHRVHYIAQQSGPCLRPSLPVPLISPPHIPPRAVPPAHSAPSQT